MKKFFLYLVIILGMTTAFAQQQMPPIPIDKNVRIGQLTNGLTYYIRHNEEPKGQANFYIAQKVGSILEEDNQRGLAHFLEHMCFNGTRNFPGNGVVKYCESIGVKFGADLNAYTSMDETVYNIDNVPVATTPSAIDSCLWILHDWAADLLLEPEDIDKERGVIHEEWRSRSSGSAQMRMYDKILPDIFPNNRYAYRMPIGTMEVVDNFPYQVLIDYYKKWYRPDQQGIIVVGDIDVDAVEAKIKTIFGTINKPENPAERFYVPVEDNQEPLISIAKDKEQQYAIVTIYNKHEAVKDNEKTDISYFIYDYAQSIIGDILSERLDELTQSATPPFIQAYAYNSGYFVAKTIESFNNIAVVNENGVANGITTLYREFLRAVRHGFTQSEYDRARNNYLTQLESNYNERNKVKSSTYCRQYVRHFIDNEPIPGAENEYMLAQQLLPNIPVSVLNDLLKQWYTGKNIAITCMLPDKEGVTYPNEQEIAEILTRVAAENITAYEDKVSNEPLIAKLPQAGKVTKTEESVFGYKKLTLANGATIYLKTTDFKADQIIMTAISEGGTSLYAESEAVNLKIASEVATLGGVGNFSATDLPKVLAGKKVSVSPSINSYSELMKGATTPKDFETMLQLTYLYFTAPRTDNEAFESWKNKAKAIQINAEKNPMQALRDTIRRTIYPALPRLQSLKLNEIDQVDYARVMQIYQERFANAADFAFIFTGNINEATAIPLIEQYIGALPANKKTEKAHDFGGTPKNGIRNNIFNRKMEIPAATVMKSWNGSANYTAKNQMVLSIADQILDILMTEEIREKEGGTYGVSVSAQLSHLPTPNLMLQVYYQTDPDKVKFLNQRIDEIIQDFATNGPSATNLAKVKEYMVKKHRENLRENRYFDSSLTEYLRTNIDNTNNYEKLLDSITADEVRLSIANLLKQNNIATIIMNGVAAK